MEFGKTLRLARENKGYTTAQLAERTHLLVQVIEGLENENFSKVPAPIYGRGFVKLYCEEVGLDPKPLITAFMEAFSQQQAPAVEPSGIQESPMPEKNIENPEPTQPQPSPSRFATPFPETEVEGFQLDTLLHNWRLLAVIGGALLVLILFICGIRALYHATMSTPVETQQEKTAIVETTATDNTPRKSTAVKPFYID